MPLPNYTFYSGGFGILSWDTDNHRVTFTTNPSGQSEFEYANYETLQSWKTGYRLGDSIPKGVVEKLSHFILGGGDGVEAG